MGFVSEIQAYWVPCRPFSLPSSAGWPRVAEPSQPWFLGRLTSHRGSCTARFSLGNLTGLTGGLSGLLPKALEMLKELVPKAKRVVLLGNPSNPGNEAANASEWSKN